ncbi:MAG: hypothetical protein ACERKZ_20515 [Lachnotalea sp.]
MPGGDGTGPLGTGNRNGLRRERNSSITQGLGRMGGEMQEGIEGFWIRYYSFSCSSHYNIFIF